MIIPPLFSIPCLKHDPKLSYGGSHLLFFRRNSADPNVNVFSVESLPVPSTSGLKRPRSKKPAMRIVSDSEDDPDDDVSDDDDEDSDDEFYSSSSKKKRQRNNQVRFESNGQILFYQLE